MESRKDLNIDKSSEPFIPTSPSELILIAVLCLISILVLVYTLVMLYRCVCSRNYAEWRAGWSHDMSYIQHDSGIQVSTSSQLESLISLYQNVFIFIQFL